MLLHSPSLCRESWARGDLALLLSPHSQAGNSLEHQTPILPGPPAHLSTFGAAPSTALIPYRAFPCSPTPRFLFGNCAAPLHTEESTQQCLFRAGETCTLQSHLKHVLKAAERPQVPGSCVCCWLSWLAFSTAAVAGAGSACGDLLVWVRKAKPTPVQVQPPQTQWGSGKVPKEWWCGMGGCSRFWHHQVFQYQWFMVRSMLVPAGSWDWRSAPSAPTSSCCTFT